MIIDPLQLALYTLSLFFIVSGFVMIILACRGKIIPFIGFKIGYVYVSPEMWKKYNLLSGIIIVILGIVVYPLSWFIGAVNSIFAVSLFVISIFFYLTLRAEREAEKVLLKKSPETTVSPEIPLTKGFKLAVPVMLISILLTTYTLSFIVLNYSALPDKIAIHFTQDWTPDSYMDKQAGITVLIFAQLIVFSITLYICYLGVKKPESFYRPYIKWEYTKRAVSILLLLILATNVIMSLAFIDVIYYGLTGKHLVLISNCFTVFHVLLAISILLIIYFAVKGYNESKKELN